MVLNWTQFIDELINSSSILIPALSSVTTSGVVPVLVSNYPHLQDSPNLLIRLIHLGTVVWLKRGQVKTVSHPACHSGSGEGGPIPGQQLIFLFPLATMFQQSMALKFMSKCFSNITCIDDYKRNWEEIEVIALELFENKKFKKQTRSFERIKMCFFSKNSCLKFFKVKM